VWGYHDACEGNGKFSLYDQAIRRRFGEPGDLAGYVSKAQLVNAESYRAIFEAVNHVGDRSAGVLLWKVNAAWPSVIWQLYDWYLCPHAGYYFTKKACEPLHIQLNLDDNRVMVINHSRSARLGLVAEAEVFSRSGETIWQRSQVTDLESGAVRALFPIPLPESREEGIRFVRVRLRDGGEGVISDSVYWQAAEDDFSGLEDLPHASPSIEAAAPEDRAGRWACDFQIHNPGPALAFFLHARVIRGRGGPEVLPCLWNDNYFSLAGGENRILSVEIPRSVLSGTAGDLYLCLSGINCEPRTVKIRSR
jgi:exo-1,4-beta-D-glucosaminidase